ncbi:MAG: hypothetical protein HY901_28235 [Deltaproteobacteria bacterium]|nr:hypothetical protein [Deltaproteobacteria bacterium]
MFAVVLAGFGLFAQLGNTVILGMTVSMVDAWLKGLKPDLGVALRDVGRNAAGIFGMAVVSAIVNMLTSRNQGRGRGLFGGLVDAAWKVLACLLMPIIMIEDLGFFAALKRARQIHSRGLLQIAVGEIGLRAIAGLSGLVIFAVLGALGLVLVPMGVPGVITLVVAGGLLLVALGIVHSFARGAYYTCLYLWAVEVERAGDPAGALVPTPLATALIG